MIENTLTGESTGGFTNIPEMDKELQGWIEIYKEAMMEEQVESIKKTWQEEVHMVLKIDRRWIESYRKWQKLIREAMMEKPVL